MSSVSSSKRNQTGLGCGVPSAAVVVSQMTISSASRCRTRAPNGVDGSGNTPDVMQSSLSKPPVDRVRWSGWGGARRGRSAAPGTTRVPGRLVVAEAGGMRRTAGVVVEGVRAAAVVDDVGGAVPQDHVADDGVVLGR